jgi:hypothetical protein
MNTSSVVDGILNDIAEGIRNRVSESGHITETEIAILLRIRESFAKYVTDNSLVDIDVIEMDIKELHAAATDKSS